MDALRLPLRPIPTPQNSSKCHGDVASDDSASDAESTERLNKSSDRAPRRTRPRAASGAASAETAMLIAIGPVMSDSGQFRSRWIGTASSTGITRAADPTKMARATTPEVPNVEGRARRSGAGRSDTESRATGCGAVATACARPLLFGSLRMATCVVVVRREVDARIAIEKAARH
jgi:hypothetical protein